jgi:hypothetical protein
MAITAQNPINTSTATAGATVFPYDFKVVDQGDMLVQVNGVTKAIGVDFTVSGVGIGTGGNITFLTPLAGGEKVLRKRNMIYQRTTDYQNLGDLRSPTLNNDQDAPVMMIQQLAADMNTRITGLDPNTIFPDSVAPQYLKTLSDVANGLEVSLHRFIDPTKLSAIRARTSIYDATANIQTALSSDVRQLFVPAGLHRYAGNMTRSNGSMTLRGASRSDSVLRCVGGGGIVFTGGAVDSAFDGPSLHLANLRIEADILNAGTAVTMTHTGGSGYPTPGPTWDNVTIGSTGLNKSFNIGVRGTNIRDFRVRGVEVFGSFQGAYPATYHMDNAFLMDGNDDPVEIWFSDLYAFYCKQVIEIAGQYEGIYVSNAYTVGIHNFLKWAAATANPVCKVADSYIACERTGILLDKVSYFQITDNCFNPTAPTPDANFVGIRIDRSAGDQTQMSDIADNNFIGTNYAGRSAFKETAILLNNANTVNVRGSTVYDMAEGIIGIAGAGNRVGPNNRYVNVPLRESLPASMRSGNTYPECNLRVAQAATQSVTVVTDTKLLWDTTLLDNASSFSNANSRWTPPGGTYDITIGAHFSTNVAAGDQVFLEFRKNGVPQFQLGSGGSKAGSLPAQLSGQVEAGGSDYFEVWCYYDGTGSARTRMPISVRNYWHATMVN